MWGLENRGESSFSMKVGVRGALWDSDQIKLAFVSLGEWSSAGATLLAPTLAVCVVAARGRGAASSGSGSGALSAWPVQGAAAHRRELPGQDVSSAGVEKACCKERGVHQDWIRGRRERERRL